MSAMGLFRRLGVRGTKRGRPLSGIRGRSLCWSAQAPLFLAAVLHRLLPDIKKQSAATWSIQAGWRRGRIV